MEFANKIESVAKEQTVVMLEVTFEPNVNRRNSLL